MAKLNAFFDKNAKTVTEDDVKNLFKMQDNAQRKAEEDAYKTRTDFNEGLKYTSLPSLNETSKKRNTIGGNIVGKAVDLWNDNAKKFTKTENNAQNYMNSFNNNLNTGMTLEKENQLKAIGAENERRNADYYRDLDKMRGMDYDAFDMENLAKHYGKTYNEVKDEVEKRNEEDKTNFRNDTWNKISDEDKLYIDDAINKASEGIGNRNITKEIALNTAMEEMQKKYGMTDEEIDDFKLSYKADRRNAKSEEKNAKDYERASKNALWGTGSSFVNTAAQPVEGLANNVFGLVTNDDRYLDHSILTNKNAKREGVKSNINSNFGKTAYDLGMGLGDMGVATGEGMVTGLSPAVFMGMNTADRAQYEALENGANVRNASAYGTVAGLSDYAFNKIGLDKIKEGLSTTTINGAKDVLRNIGSGALTEAGENVLQDITESVADNIINGENSAIRNSYATYLANGMTPSDALAQTTKDYGNQLLMSGATGALFGGAFAGGKIGIDAISDARGYKGNSVVNSLMNANNKTEVDVNDVNAVPKLENVKTEAPKVETPKVEEVDAKYNKVMAEDTGIGKTTTEQNESDAWNELVRASQDGEEVMRLGDMLEDENIEPADITTDRSEYVKAMEDRYLTDSQILESKIKQSKGVTNSGRRIDAERSADEEARGLGVIFQEGDEETFTKAHNNVTNDYKGTLNKYLKNEGDDYDGSDYDAIMLLTEDIKARKKLAIEEGNRAGVDKYNAQLDLLTKTRLSRGTNAGRYIQAAKKWIRTAEGAIDVATHIVDDALDNIEGRSKVEAQNIIDTADDITTRVQQELETNELWEALLREQRREELVTEIQKMITDMATDRDIEVNDELSKKLANSLLEGAHASDIARNLAIFREYGFLGLSDELIDEVETIFDDAEKYPINSRRRVKAEEEAYKLLAKELYKKGGTTLEKLDTWRYLAMLGNFKTHGRNVTSTATFSEVVNRASNILAATMEGATDNTVKLAKLGLSKIKGTEYDGKGIQRTKAFINPVSDINLIKEAFNDSEVNYRPLTGQKYIESVASGIESQKPVFNENGAKIPSLLAKGVNTVSDANTTALSAEDFFFKRNKYTTSLAGYLKANGADENIFNSARRYAELDGKKRLTADEKAEKQSLAKDAELLEKARDYAVKEAQYATFNTRSQGVQDFSKFVKSWRESDKGAKRFVGNMIEGLVPFKNTPVNIVKTIGDYSPIGLVKGIYKTLDAINTADGTREGIIKVGKHNGIGYTVSDAFSDLSKGLTGAGMMWLGAKLSQAGILQSSLDNITGNSDQTEGKQKYSLNINGKSYTIDFLVPSAVPLLLGAEMDKLMGDSFTETVENMSKQDMDAWLDTTLQLIDPVLETSMLSGFDDYITNIRYSDSKGEATVNALAGPFLSYAQQFMPTVDGHIARTIDNTRRSTRTNSDGAVSGLLERTSRQIANKSILAKTLNPDYNNAYVDMWGNKQNNAEGNVLQRLAYQTMSPSYVNDLKTEPYQAELDRLYEATKDENVLNSKIGNSIDSERLSNDDYFKKQTITGNAKKEFITSALDNSEYQKLADNPELQAEVMKDLMKLADDIGTKEIRPDKKISNSMLKVYNENGIDAVIKESIAKNNENFENDAIEEMGYTANAMTRKMYEAGDTKSLERYEMAQKIAKDNGANELTEKQWKIYKAKGAGALAKEVKYSQSAKEYGVTDTEAFREAYNKGKQEEYAKKYKDITSIVVGADEYGEPKHLEYSDKLSTIYDEKNGKKGVNIYLNLLNNSKNGEGKIDQSKAVNAVKNSSYLSKSDKGYYLSKILNINDNAKIHSYIEKGNYGMVYDYYNIKNLADTDKNGSIAVEKELVPYLKKQNYPSSKKNEIVRLFQDSRSKKVFF